MAPILQLQPLHPQYHQLSYGEDEVGQEGCVLDLTISSMANMDSYAPIDMISRWEFPQPLRFPASPPEEPMAKSCKRVKLGDGGNPRTPISPDIADEDDDHLHHNERKQKPRFRDHIWSFKQKLQDLELLDESAVVDGDFNVCGATGGDDISGGTGSDGMRLVQLLISCAEAVACRDRAQASTLLLELKGSAQALGTSFQRVASCFVQGLSDRLALVQPLGTVGIIGPLVSPAGRAASYQKDAALALAYELCPYIRFGHFVANTAILEAFEGESLVHVVDLGMTLGLPGGHQWQDLLRSLAARGGTVPRRVRITGVGPCADRLRAIGEELERVAAGLGLQLEFFGIESTLENLRRRDFQVEEGEVLAVSSVLQLHCVVKESRGALNSVLQMIRELSPRVLTLVEQDSSHNGPFFLGRFMEALHYYSAIFDSLDATLPRHDTRRAKVEHFYFAEEIKNIVSCEGPARVERHERVDQWRRRMSRAGFQPQPVKMMGQAKQWLAAEAKGGGEGYTVAEEKGCLVVGWKSKPIMAASCWKC